MVGIHGVGSSSRPLVAARKATDRLGDQMTQARHAREKARVLRGFPDGRPDDDAASREAPHKGAAVPEPERATIVQGWAEPRGAVSWTSGAECVVGIMGGLLGFKGARRGVSLARPRAATLPLPFSCSAPAGCGWTASGVGHAPECRVRFVFRPGHAAARATRRVLDRGEAVKAALTRRPPCGSRTAEYPSPWPCRRGCL